MARTARVVAVGYPHHVIQRGNRRQKVFFSDSDKFFYLELLQQKSQKYLLDIWAYCLMDNHIHLIVVPRADESISLAVGEMHKEYTRMINFREGWGGGHLWQGRFKSFVMQERYLYAAIRYVERNPMRAKIVKRAQDYPWSSAQAHVSGEDHNFLKRIYLQDEIKDWSGYLNSADEHHAEIAQCVENSRPWGNEIFIEKLERLLGRSFQRKKPGPKSKLN